MKSWMTRNGAGSVSTGYSPPALVSCTISSTSVIAEPTTPSQVRSRWAIAVKQAAASSTTPIDSADVHRVEAEPEPDDAEQQQRPERARCPTTGSQPAIEIRHEDARPASARPEIGRITRNTEMPNTQMAMAKKNGASPRP